MQFGTPEKDVVVDKNTSKASVFGLNNVVLGKEVLALGNNNNVNGENSTAIGTQSTADGINALVPIATKLPGLFEFAAAGSVT